MKKNIIRHSTYVIVTVLLLSMLINPVTVSSESHEGTINVFLRIEGLDNSIYGNSVTTDSSEITAWEIIEEALHEEDIIIKTTEYEGSGLFIDSIDGLASNQYGDEWAWWKFAVNNELSNVGVSGYQVSDGDVLCLFYGGSDTLIPEVKISSSEIKTNEEFIVTVTAVSEKYDENFNYLGTEEVNIEGAMVEIDDSEYFTDVNGEAFINGISEPGEYYLKVGKEREGSYPAILRTGDTITISVQGSPEKHDLSALLEETVNYYQQEKRLRDWQETLVFQADGVDILDGTWDLPEWSNDDLDVDAAAIKYPGIIIGLITTGKNPADIWDGRNLVKELVDMQGENGDFPGTLNATIYAMMVLDMAYVDYDKDRALKHILKSQNDDGGFVFFGQDSDVDSTAMTLTFLSNYMEEDNVIDTISKALDFLESQQHNSGGFASWGSENANSTACVLSALVSVGENIYSDRWVKNGRYILDALLDYRIEDGSYSFMLNPLETNSMATRDVFMTLSDLVAGEAAYFRHGFSYTKGYVAGNEEITVSDAIAILRYVVGLKDLDYYSYLAADVNDDGKVNVTDAIQILRYIAGIQE